MIEGVLYSYLNQLLIYLKRNSLKTEVIWEGYISSSGIVDAKLFDGTVSILGDEGNWKI